MTFTNTRKYLLIGALSTLLVACGDEPEKQTDKPTEQNMLAYVPADTPYVIANTKRLPRQDIELLIKKFSKIYSSMSLNMQQTMEAEGLTDKPAGKVLKVLVDELFTDFSLEKMEAVGFKPDAYMALYGLGILPMMHLELADEEKFRAFLSRLETEAGDKLPVAEFEGKPYWRIEIEEAVVSMALVDGQLIIGLTPTALQEKQLPYLLGKKPEKSLAETDRLTSVINDFGFLGYGTGFVDFQQLVATAFGDKSGLSQEIWAALNIEQGEVPEQCHKELTTLVAKAPKMVFGYTEFSPKLMEQKLVLELESSLATSLQKLSTSVPGIGSKNGLMNIGFGFNVVEAQKFLLSTAQERANTPFQCEWLLEMNKMGTAESQAPLKAPLPPFAADIKGVNLVVQELEMDKANAMTPPKAKVQAVLRADNPQNLYGMAAMMLPGVAELQLQPDGVVHAIPATIIPPVVDAPHVAMSDKGFGLSIGEGMETSLPTFMSAAPAPDQPIFAISYDMGLMVQMMKPAMTMAMAGMEPKEVEMMENQLAIMESYKDIFGPFGLSISFTPKGVQLHQSIELK